VSGGGSILSAGHSGSR